MYVSNRKNGYKVIKQYKSSPRVKLLNVYGAEFVVDQSALDQNGYKYTKSKPVTFRAGV